MGVIRTDTVWSGRVVLSTDVEVAAGATLTIAPGTIVEGRNRSIEVTGTLRAVGTVAAPILLEETFVELRHGSNAQNAVHLAHAHVLGGGFLTFRSDTASGHVSVDHVLFDRTDQYTHLRYVDGASHVADSVFHTAQGVSIGTDTRFTFTGNVVWNQQPFYGELFALQGFAATGGALVSRDNAYLSGNRTALLAADRSVRIESTGDYFVDGHPASRAAVVVDRADGAGLGTVALASPRAAPPPGIVDTVRSFATLALPPAVLRHVVLVGEEDAGATGNGLANRLAGNGGDNRLVGLDGEDTLEGGDGRDTLEGGDGADRLDGGRHDDSLFDDHGGDVLWGGRGNDHLVAGRHGDELDGGAGRDTLEGGGGNDRAIGSGGHDRLDGGRGKDDLEGGGGKDTLEGGGGHDRLDGGGQADRLVGGGGKDTLDGGNGADLLKGNGKADRLAGGNGGDTLAGGAGGDRLDGGRGGDRLNGGAGNDRLTGGGGDDRLTGGGGKDVFVFSHPRWGTDRIDDFGRGRDRLDFSGSGLERGDLSIVRRGEDVVIEVAGDPEGGTVVLVGGSGVFDPGDFLF